MHHLITRVHGEGAMLHLFRHTFIMRGRLTNVKMDQRCRDQHDFGNVIGAQKLEFF